MLAVFVSPLDADEMKDDSPSDCVDPAVKTLASALVGVLGGGGGGAGNFGFIRSSFQAQRDYNQGFPQPLYLHTGGDLVWE